MEYHVGKRIILEEPEDIAISLLSNDRENPPDAIFAQTNCIFIKARCGNKCLTTQSYELDSKEMTKQ